ncbi:pyridoxamine 5'-phosphate oxidase family protein [Pseudonocardia nigra]|uniref:pyridoxamine 5'-phosphate oxidase family protein n=1 Tax=Pseudonocardia nigra TaxID=1921578 RepID=UPI001C5FA7CB|nr:pyridoxamine 5'-phosphate oxidase family protein [Pseudonocardia nigra]
MSGASAEGATGVRRPASFAPLRDDVADVLARINYATMTTVDRKGRPRSRLLIAVWELDGDRPVGWLATFRTPVKVAHLAHNPHATFSYWSPRQDVVSFDTVAEWVEDPEVKRRVWELYRTGSPAGVGYDPQPFWPAGPDGPGFHVLRLDPYRVQVLRGRELAAGVAPRIWRGEDRA